MIELSRASDSGGKVQEGGAVAVERDGEFGRRRASHRLRSFGQIAAALQNQLCRREAVAECGDIHDNGARITRSIVIGRKSERHGP